MSNNEEIIENDKIENEKVNKTEKEYIDFLNKEKITFVYLNQEKTTFSKIFWDKNMKRPDFIISTENELYCIDVKKHKKMEFGKNNELRFYISAKDIIKLNGFQKDFKINVLIAITDDNLNFNYILLNELYKYYSFIYEKTEETIKLYKNKFGSRYFSDHFFLYIPEEIILKDFNIENSINELINTEFVYDSMKDVESYIEIFNKRLNKK